MQLYLKICRNLPTYGCNIFHVEENIQKSCVNRFSKVHYSFNFEFFQIFKNYFYLSGMLSSRYRCKQVSFVEKAVINHEEILFNL